MAQVYWLVEFLLSRRARARSRTPTGPAIPGLVSRT